MLDRTKLVLRCPKQKVRRVGSLVHFAKRAGARAARIAAGTARSGGSGRSRSPLGRHREDRQLRFKLPGVALGTLGLLFPKNQGLEMVTAFLADVLVDRHFAYSSRGQSPEFLTSIATPEGPLFHDCGHEARLRTQAQRVPDTWSAADVSPGGNIAENGRIVR